MKCSLSFLIARLHRSASRNPTTTYLLPKKAVQVDQDESSPSQIHRQQPLDYRWSSARFQVCMYNTYNQPAISPTIIKNIETGEIRHDLVKILRELYPKTQTNRAAGLSEPLILDTQPDLLNGSA
ncbi:hypothetical protein N656DRAFT_521228 [Canariomyces notabilis]|uniref:Uncharacterized protein n=1 Tax=Canariomyces notabilis TaxID=2074819 RepID=A0AAN6T7W6_9PEZI|nr:hypothetical protein N656DRAFT_521228 [Canariomyces arenarius]